MTTPNDRTGADPELERGARRGIDGNLEGRVPESPGAVDDGERPPALDDLRDGVELVPIRPGQLEVPRDEAQAVTRMARELGRDHVPGDAARVPAGRPRAGQGAFRQQRRLAGSEDVEAFAGCGVGRHPSRWATRERPRVRRRPPDPAE